MKPDSSVGSLEPRSAVLTGDRTRASDLIFNHIAERIRKIDLLPGQSISENEFAAYYGVSRTPVRSAITALAQNGMVRVIPQVGTRVSFIDFAEVEQAQFVRESLETNALRYVCAAQHRDFSELNAILEKQRGLAGQGDPEAFFQADEAFHRQTFVLAGYSGAWSVVGRSRFQLDRIRRLSIGLTHHNKLQELCDEHADLLQHLVNRDEDHAIEELKVHMRRYLVESHELQRTYPSYFSGSPSTILGA